MRPARLERATYSFGGCHSIQLSYGRSLAATIDTRVPKHNRAAALVLTLVIGLVLEHAPGATVDSPV